MPFSGHSKDIEQLAVKKSLDASWKFSACKNYKNCSNCIFIIYASKNEVVGCEVQTHFGSFLLARFLKRK